MMVAAARRNNLATKIKWAARVCEPPKVESSLMKRFQVSATCKRIHAVNLAVGLAAEWAGTC
ncbi:MAG: hypothetical protein WCQ03_08630, partial [Phycisphaerae bacterium]